MSLKILLLFFPRFMHILFWKKLMKSITDISRRTISWRKRTKLRVVKLRKPLSEKEWEKLGFCYISIYIYFVKKLNDSKVLSVRKQGVIGRYLNKTIGKTSFLIVPLQNAKVRNVELAFILLWTAYKLDLFFAKMMRTAKLNRAENNELKQPYIIYPFQLLFSIY